VRRGIAAANPSIPLTKSQQRQWGALLRTGIDVLCSVVTLVHFLHLRTFHPLAVAQRRRGVGGGRIWPQTELCIKAVVTRGRADCKHQRAEGKNRTAVLIPAPLM
jgi:hypothetical protein